MCHIISYYKHFLEHLYHIVLPHDIACFFWEIKWYFMPSQTVLSHVMSNYIVSYCIALYRIILHQSKWYCITLLLLYYILMTVYHNMLYYTTIYNIILHYSIFNYVILYYLLLYYICFEHLSIPIKSFHVISYHGKIDHIISYQIVP